MDLKAAVAKRLADKELEKEVEKKRLGETLKQRVLEKEAGKTFQQTPYGLFGVREGVYTLETSPGSPPVKIVASDIPNFDKFMAEGKIKKIAGRKSRRSRKPKNKKNRSTRRR